MLSDNQLFSIYLTTVEGSKGINQKKQLFKTVFYLLVAELLKDLLCGNFAYNRNLLISVVEVLPLS